MRAFLEIAAGMLIYGGATYVFGLWVVVPLLLVHVLGFEQAVRK